jgi:hypothetical protein
MHTTTLHVDRVKEIATTMHTVTAYAGTNVAVDCRVKKMKDIHKPREKEPKTLESKAMKR